MKYKIGRTLILFSDENGKINELNKEYFCFSHMLNRLLNEKYTGKKIEFLNIYFETKESYEKYPQVPMYHVHYYGGHLQYHGLIDLKELGEMSEDEQKYFVWKRACDYLQEAAKKLNNEELFEAAKYAFERGLELKLNPDYKALEADVLLYEQTLKASIWYNFRHDATYSKLALERDGKVIFEKDIDKGGKGNEFFFRDLQRHSRRRRQDSN